MQGFKECFPVGNKEIGRGLKPLIIAEMACAHDGDFEKAKKLIDASATAGADVVQLQFFSSDYVVTPKHEAFNLLKDIEFSPDQWGELTRYAEGRGILVFACTYDNPSVELAKKLNVAGIKLNSADLGNPDILAEVAQTKIPFTLGTGASTLDEINRALQLIRKEGGDSVALMHGVQNFPTKTKDLHIRRIGLLGATFGLPVGYHDHTDGGDPYAGIIDLIAVGMGAAVIEKHITLDRSEKGTDYQAALEPDGFKAFVENIDRASVALGSREVLPFGESELKYRKFQKKSIVTARPLSSDETISRGDVIFIRNDEPGLSPFDFAKIEGKKARRALDKFENIQFDDVE